MLPNFIMIGAAKAGTTALHHYLVEHPQVFMTAMKDPSYFAYGVGSNGTLLWGDPEMHAFPVRSLSEYERLFADAGDALAIGEASTMYLECPQSATRIHRLLPAARIVCSLRHPVDRAYSDYQMYLRNRGRRLDPAREFAVTAEWARPDSHWMRIGRYYEQLRRYYETFPRSQIHVILFDDLKRDAQGTVQAIYRFLGVDPAFRPDFETPHNIGGMPASPLLERLLTKSALRFVVEPFVPKRTANWARRLRTRAMRPAPRLPAEIRKTLADHFRDDLLKTSDLIGRDLTHWL